MPPRPAWPCSYPGCHQLAPCPTHQRRPTWHVNPARGSVKERGYSGKHVTWWRHAVLREHPFCSGVVRGEGCPQQAVATVADHIIPLSRGGDALDLNNGQGLCRSCHAKKSRLERGGAGQNFRRRAI